MLPIRIITLEIRQNFRLCQTIYFIRSKYFIPKYLIALGIIFCLSTFKNTILIRPGQYNFTAFRQKVPIFICQTYFVFERSIAVWQKAFVHYKLLKLYFIKNHNATYFSKEIAFKTIMS